MWTLRSGPNLDSRAEVRTAAGTLLAEPLTTSDTDPISGGTEMQRALSSLLVVLLAALSVSAQDVAKPSQESRPADPRPAVAGGWRSRVEVGPH